MHQATLNDLPMLPERLYTIPLDIFVWDALIAFLGMAFYGASCISLGLRFSSFLHTDGISSKNTHLGQGVFLITCFLIGNTLYSIVFLAVASLSDLSTGQSVTILCFGFLSGLTKFKKVKAPFIKFGANQGIVFVPLSMAVLVVTVLQTASHLSYDASAIYFSIAKLTALQYHAGYYLENSFPVSVLHSTITYSVVMQIFGDQSARMISWLFGAVNIVIAMALTEHIGASALAKRILPPLILTSTAFLDQMGDGKVELFSSAYALIAIYWLLVQARETYPLQVHFFLSGGFIGFSCILRPYNVFLLGMFVIIYFVYCIKIGHSSLSRSAQQMMWMVLGAGGFIIYHLIINKMLLGSPFAFWTSITGINPDGPWDFNARAIWIYRLLYPFVVTFKNTGASLGNITPLVLVFVPLLLVRDIRKSIPFQRDTWQLFLPAVITLSLWVILSFAIVEVRYVLFLWIILFVPIAEIAARALESENKWLKNMVLSSTTVLMGFVLIRSVFLSTFTYSPVKEGDPRCFKEAICGHFVSINHIAAPGERVLTLSGYRYYLRADLFACSTNDTEYKILKKFTPQDSEAFWQEVYRLGYKYIGYEKGYTTDHVLFLIIPGPDNTPDWINLEPIFGEPGDLQIAYKINVTDPPIRVETNCKKNENTDIWEVQAVTP